MTYRINNFSAGPCALPLSVLQIAQKNLLNFQNSGMSVMEISHRDPLFEEIHFKTLDLAGKILQMPDDFTPILLTGGAHQQFAMTAQNLLDQNSKAGFINSGIWSNKAFLEAKRVGNAQIIWQGNQNNLPDDDCFNLDDSFAYLHITSNETINGIQFQKIPFCNRKIVVDASSDYYTKNIEWEKMAIVYGGVQKNLAPSGLSLVFVNKNYLNKNKDLPHFYNYHTHYKSQSLYNTPPTWQIYLLYLVFNWMIKKGGLDYFIEQTQKKSQLLYDFIDNSRFYNNFIKPKYRSKTNIVFTTNCPKLDQKFHQTARKKGFFGLKGHKLVQGLRASLYNAVNYQSVKDLIKFMMRFEKDNAK